VSTIAAPEAAVLICAKGTLVRELSDALSPLVRDVWSTDTADGAEVLLRSRPPWVVIDPGIVGRPAREQALALLRSSPAPAVVFLGADVEVEDAFELARAGVHGVFATGSSPPDVLAKKVVRALQCAADPWPLVRSQVGRTPMRTFLAEARTIFLREALARAGGSRSEAARIVGISRQAIEQTFQRPG
jgi:DNA-binding NarL/FixJ family response regulator